MAGPLQFQFELLDRMSPAAKDISKSVTAANAALKAAGPAATAAETSTLKMTIAEAKAAAETRKLTKELDGLTKMLAPTKKLTVEMGNMFSSFAGFRKSTEGGWIFNLADGLKSVLHVVTDIAGGFYDLTAGAVRVGAATEKSGRAFKLNLGGAVGKDVLNYIDAVEEKLKGAFTKEQLRSQVLPLAQQGFGVKDISRILASAHGVGARGGSAEGAIGALGGIKTGQNIDLGTLNALGYTSRAEQVRVAKLLGGSGANLNPSIALGQVSARTAVSPHAADKAFETILDDIRKRSGGKFGTEGVAASQSPQASLDRLANLNTILAEQLSANGGLSGFYKAIDRFVDVLTGPEGKGFRDAMIGFVDTIAILLEKASGWFGDKNPAQKVIEQGGLGVKFDKRGNATEAVSDEERTALLERAGYSKTKQILLGGKKSPEAWDEIARQRYVDERNTHTPGTPANSTGVLAPSEAQQFGYNSELGAIQARAEANGVPPAIPKANDMIWRGNSAVEIDPADTLMAFKRGGSLGAGEGGSSGGAPSIVFQFDHIEINGAGKNGSQLADEFLQGIKDRGAATLLLSAFEQLAQEQAA